ncbi:MAG TPA: NADH:flavin oxidoreductase [Planctomycetaceae bacterium]|nr:NADH:flavin oxidoreductase [Planctomycetaceae bacterium]
MTTSPLFTPLAIGSMTLKNRFVRSATWEGLAGDDGSVTERLCGLIDNVAAGELGMIISGHAFVSREGQAGPWQLGIYDDRLAAGLTELATRMKRHGSAAVAQLAHAGGQAAQMLTGTQPVGPSPMTGRSGAAAREMTVAEITQTVEAFARAATRARTAGFDAVQLHGAHGFLLSQFLSPHFNRRTDGYGGDVAGRARFLLETVAAVRAAVGPGYPILAKINADDFLDDGFNVDHMIETCRMLQDASLDAVELSGGTVADESRYSSVRTGEPARPEEEVYYRKAAERFKKEVGLPLILVGGIRSFDVAERIITDGLADAVAVSRPLIVEPGLVARWKSGDHGPSTCLSCNQCFEPGMMGEGIRCVLE